MCKYYFVLPSTVPVGEGGGKIDNVLVCVCPEQTCHLSAKLARMGSAQQLTFFKLEKGAPLGGSLYPPMGGDDVINDVGG